MITWRKVYPVPCVHRPLSDFFVYAQGLFTNMYINMCIYTHTHIRIYIYIYIWLLLKNDITGKLSVQCSRWSYMCVWSSCLVCLCACVCMYIYIYMYIYIHMYIYIYIYVYTHNTHTHTYLKYRRYPLCSHKKPMYVCFSSTE